MKIPKAQEDLPPAFLRQRRDMLVTGLVLLAIAFFGDPCKDKFTFLGSDLKISYPTVLILGSVFLVYFTWRAWQQVDWDLVSIGPQETDRLLKALIQTPLNKQDYADINQIELLPDNLNFNRAVFYIKDEGGKTVKPLFQKFGDIGPNLKQRLQHIAKTINFEGSAEQFLPLFAVADSFNLNDPQTAINLDISIDLKLFKRIRREPKAKQFWKYSFFSDYQLPFLIATVTFYVVIFRLLKVLL